MHLIRIVKLIFFVSILFAINLLACAKVESLVNSSKNELSIVSGNDQALDSDAATSESLKIALKSNGEPVVGETITYKVVSGNSVELVETSAKTDTEGQASVTCRSTRIEGDTVVSAAWSSQIVLFKIKVKSAASSGTIGSLTKQFFAVQGNNATLSASGSKVLKVMAIDGLTTAGIADVVVTFQVYPATAGTLTGGGSTGTRISASTGSDGSVSITFNASASIGPVVVTATSSAGGTSFNLTVGAAGTGSQILKVTGDGSAISTSSSQLLKLLALDINNSPIVGSAVTFSVSAGGTGTLTGALQSYSTTTDAEGYASVTYSSGTTSGATSVVALVSSIGSASFTVNVSFSGGGGGGGGSTIVFSPTALSPAATTWLNVPISGTANKSVTVSNATSGNIYVNSISSTTSHFTIVSDTCTRAPTAMASAATCTITIRFAPTATGTVDRFLYFNWSSSSDGSSPQLSTVALQGTGPDPISDFAGITSVNSISYDRMTLNWSNYAGNNGYAIYRISGGTATWVNNVSIGTTSYTATGLTASTSYTWRVNVYNSAIVIDTNTTTVSGTTLATPTVPSLTIISTSAYIMANGAQTNGIRAGEALTIDVNNIVAGSPGNDTGMTYTCTVGRTMTNSCGTGSKTACSSTTLPGVYTLGSSTGALSWTPAYQSQGTYEFCITGTDANGSGTAIFPVNVVHPTYGKATGDSTSTFISDWRAAFSNFSAVATGTTWEAIFGSFGGTITGPGTWAGANSNTYLNPLRMNFTSTTLVDFGAAITGYTSYLWDIWVNNTNASFSSSNNTAVVLSKDSTSSDHGFSLTHYTDPLTSAKQLKFQYSKNYSAMVIADGATVYYPFDDAAGTVLTDAIGGVGGGNNGTLVPANFAFGVAGALEHETNNRTMERVTTAAFGVLPNTNSFKPTNNFSLELWFKIPISVNAADIFNYSSTLDSDGISIVGYGAYNKMAVRDQCGGSAARTLVGNHIMMNHDNRSALNLDGQWHHIVVTYTQVSGTNYRTVYIDGMKTLQITCGTSATPITWAATPTNRNFGNQAAGVAIDEFALYGSTVLTAEQVKNHYMAATGIVAGQASFPSNAQMQDGPVGYWRLGESVGATRAVDSSGYGNHGAYGTAPLLGQAGAFARTGIAAISNSETTTNAPGSNLDDSASITIPSAADAVTIPGSLSLNFTQMFTAAAWIYFPATPSGNSTGKVLISQDSTWYLYLCTSPYWGQIRLSFTSAAGCGGGIASPSYSVPEPGYGTAMHPNGWYHIAVVYDGTQTVAGNRVRFYVNGNGFSASTATTTLVGTYTGTPAVRIGRDLSGVLGNPQALGDSIRYDEVVLYNKALTSTQIMAQVWDGSYRYCKADVTTTFTSPSIPNTYDHIAAMLSGGITTFYVNGRQKCSLRTGSTIDFSTDTNSFQYGSSTSGFVGNITEGRVYAANSPVATATSIKKNFMVGADLHRPQPIGNIQLTGLNIALEPGSSRDGLRPNDTAGTCSGANNFWFGLGNAAVTGQLYNFINCSATNAWKGTGLAGTDPYKIVFSGASSMYVDLGSSTDMDGTALASVCSWVNTSSLPVSTGIVSKAKTSNAIFLGGDDTTAGKIQFNINGIANKAVSTNSIADGTWHYACGTYDGSYVRLYVDGAFQSRATYSTVIATTTDQLSIGANVNAGRASVSEPFTGSIGGVHIYSTAITSSDIYNNCVAQAALYTTASPTTFCTLSGMNP